VTATAHGPRLEPRTLDEAVAALRERGIRVTAARRLVLQGLFAADGPVSAERLASGVDGAVPPSDLASVYRNLEALERVGLVRHVHLGHGPGLYTRATPEAREYLVCERCGDIQAVDAARLDEVRDSIRQTFGFEARFSHFPIAGLCSRCAV
jgi:Fur family transcriptional regulator, ferric uptake regulator